MNCLSASCKRNCTCRSICRPSYLLPTLSRSIIHPRSSKDLISCWENLNYRFVKIKETVQNKGRKCRAGTTIIKMRFCT